MLVPFHVQADICERRSGSELDPTAEICGGFNIRRKHNNWDRPWRSKRKVDLPLLEVVVKMFWEDVKNFKKEVREHVGAMGKNVETTCDQMNVAVWMSNSLLQRNT